MSANTRDVLIKCYSEAREGFAIIKNDVIHHANKALITLAGYDISSRLAMNVFPDELLDMLCAQIRPYIQEDFPNLNYVTFAEKLDSPNK